MPILRTTRLELLPGAEPHFLAALVGRDALAQALGAQVPESWPPEFYDEDAVRYSLARVREHPLEMDWGFYYVVRRAPSDSPGLLIGAGGFKDAPDAAGVVELGYGIVPDQHRLGYATEAVRELTRFAFESGRAEVLVGQTLPRLIPSIGVLLKCGFTLVGEGHDAHAPEGEPVLRYELTRSAWSSAS